ncbi:MAG: hypothetical protein F6J98_28645 [Moorea sp. SIO4G2]|nr:hypothetical protein [Moorena sp. SIO4G2]
MATFTVDTLIDENDGIGTGGVSLRDAIEAANDPGGDDQDTIIFASSLNEGTITLTHGELLITSNLSIEGNGANITVDANGQSRVFNVNDGNGSPDQTVGINGLTITGGNASSGGGIYNNEILTINNSTIANNVAASFGGGIYIFGSGTANIANSTIANNQASDGGGIEILGGTANIANSTIVKNQGSNIGGGIDVYNGTANIANSTIANNQASDGGGIYIFGSGTANIANSTIANNQANEGGGIDNDGGTANIASTIIAANNANNVGDDINGAFTSLGNNLIGNGETGSGFTNGVNGDLVGTTAAPIDPLLGPLQNNGGPTETLALDPGSPAIDAGSNPNGLTTDQRGAGFDRVVGSSADIGAFELKNDRILLGTLRNDLLVGVDGNDRLFGFTGTDTLEGNGGSDTLQGGFGNDILDGGQGNDSLKGGFGSDLFVLRAGDGEDSILDYSDGIDQFMLDGLSFEQLEIVQGDNGTVVQVDSTDEVLASLVGVDASVIDAGDFISI